MEPYLLVSALSPAGDRAQHVTQSVPCASISKRAWSGFLTSQTSTMPFLHAPTMSAVLGKKAQSSTSSGAANAMDTPRLGSQVRTFLSSLAVIMRLPSLRKREAVNLPWCPPRDMTSCPTTASQTRVW